MKKLEYKISIAADREKVWHTMLNQETYKQWVDVAWPGSFCEGAWERGADLRFISVDGSGTLAHLLEYRPYDFILAEHIAILNKGGVEDRDSELAKGWIGTTESYDFIQNGNETELKVTLNINPEWAPMFDEGWPKALAKLKEISELETILAS